MFRCLGAVNFCCHPHLGFPSFPSRLAKNKYFVLELIALMPLPLEMTGGKLLLTSAASSKENNWTLSGVAIVSPECRGYLKILALGLPGKYYFPFRGKFLFPVSNVSSPKKLSTIFNHLEDASRWIFDCFIL